MTIQGEEVKVAANLVLGIWDTIAPVEKPGPGTFGDAMESLRKVVEP